MTIDTETRDHLLRIADEVERVREHVKALRAENEKLREALEGVESWWLSDGQHAFDGAPAALFNVRAVLAEAESLPYWAG